MCVEQKNNQRKKNTQRESSDQAKQIKRKIERPIEKERSLIVPGLEATRDTVLRSIVVQYIIDSLSVSSRISNRYLVVHEIVYEYKAIGGWNLHHDS